ncbi:MAG: MFS transporter [Rubrobacteraceae bacterium]
MDNSSEDQSTSDDIKREEAVERKPYAAPQEYAGKGFIIAYALAYFGLWATLLTPVVVSLAIKVQQVDPQTPVRSLSLVLGTGAFLALASNPVFGKLSDRTTSRFGMRRPWLLGGAVAGTLALLVVATAQSIFVVLVGWCLAQLAYNALYAAITALLPDQVPPAQRGRISGILGMCQPPALVAGTFLAQLGPGVLWMFMGPAAVGLVTVVGLVVVLNDDRRQQHPGYRPRYTLREFASSFWVNPRRHPDFGWAFLSRFLLFMGVATLITYQVYYLSGKLGVPTAEVPRMVFISAVVLNIMIVPASVLSGWVSDRLGRRKALVFASALVLAMGFSVIAFAGSIPVFLAGVAIAGAGHGVYVAVDLALVSEVLPSPDDAAKDLGVSNIASAAPQSLAPAIAPLFLAVPLFASGEGGNYTALFLAAAIFATLAAFAIRPVKGVK